MLKKISETAVAVLAVALFLLQVLDIVPEDTLFPIIVIFIAAIIVCTAYDFARRHFVKKDGIGNFLLELVKLIMLSLGLTIFIVLYINPMFGYTVYIIWFVCYLAVYIYGIIKEDKA